MRDEKYLTLEDVNSLKGRLISSGDSLEYILKCAEEDDNEEEIKFQYSKLIRSLKPQLIIQILQECGVKSITIQKEVMIKRTPLGDKEVDKSEFYKECLENPNKIGNYFSKYKFFELNLNKIGQLNCSMDSYTYYHIENEVYDALLRNLAMNVTNRNCIGGERASRKEIRKKLNSLLHLNKLENHIKRIIEQIKNSDLRNYADAHTTEIFKDGVIFKVYREQEAGNRLKNEFMALSLLSKKLPNLYTPKIYCHGKLNDFYILLIEKIKGVTADKFLNKIHDPKKKKLILKNTIEHLVNIHIEGRNLNTTYGTIKEKNCLDWLKIGFFDRLNEKCKKKLESLIKYYQPIAEQLANYKIKVFNKDANLKNWIISNYPKFYCAIDFENTSIRPPQLDLVQLLEDDNLNLKDEDKEELKKHYITAFNKKANPDMPKIQNYEEFNIVYHCALLHRKLIHSGFSSEKFATNNPRKCKYLQLKNLNSCLKSIDYLRENERESKKRQQYTSLCSIITDLKKEIRML